ncbi:MAG: LysR family transcriptional regulator [Gammaproteobacteria bacterium]|nr:LysR family transcriptional regulator [Gammaproteobacteria bacterium]
MDIKELHAFITVADVKSVSLAAEQIHLTQPAVSKRIASLEIQLGTALFDRIGRQLKITEAGMAFLPLARNILQTVEDGKKAVQNLTREVIGDLRLGTSHHIGLHRLPPVLRRFSQDYEKVNLQLHFNDSEIIIEKVLHGELDIGVVTLPERDIEHLGQFPAWTDKLHFVIGKDYPVKKTISAAELATMRSVLPERGTVTRDILEHKLRKEGVTLKETLSTNYLETIKMMVSVGLGWSILPETMLSDELQSFKVKGLQLSRNLGIVYDTRRTLPNSAKTFIKLIQGK